MNRTRGGQSPGRLTLLPNRAGRLLVAFVLGATPFLAVPLAAHAATVDSNFTVTDLNNGVTATDLANQLVGGGVTVSSVSYTGNIRAAGKFTVNNPTTLGFGNGIVLSTGKVQTYSTDPNCSQGIEGPNTCYEAWQVPAPGGGPGPSGTENSTAFGTAGDADLTALSGFSTFDAAVLQFDFVPSFSTVQFQYVFSSEEYSDFANTSFNDVFGFFVNGHNCAVVPATTNTPVSINTINNGNDQLGGDATPHNAAFFRDNVRPSPGIDIQMDGLTTVLTCNANVNAGVTNHMKLAIADASDAVFDSAVFLKGGSLISGTVMTTSLQGGGQSGTAITVNQGTAVTDSATLTGANASTATGTVTYKVYSDNTCTTLFASAGTKTVTGGVVPNSDPVTMSAAGTFYWVASYSGDALNNPSSNACGSETVTVTGADTVPPTCALTSAIDGPPAQIVVTVQDAQDGLSTITASGTNDIIVVDAFTPGTTNPVNITATKIDQTSGATLDVVATDVSGNTTICDPTLVTDGSGKPTHATVNGSEGKVTVANAGLNSLTIEVNGHKFTLRDIAGQQHLTLNISSALMSGSNAVTVHGQGNHGTSAVVVFST